MMLLARVVALEREGELLADGDPWTCAHFQIVYTADKAASVTLMPLRSTARVKCLIHSSAVPTGSWASGVGCGARMLKVLSRC